MIIKTIYSDDEIRNIFEYLIKKRSEQPKTRVRIEDINSKLEYTNIYKEQAHIYDGDIIRWKCYLYNIKDILENRKFDEFLPYLNWRD